MCRAVEVDHCDITLIQVSAPFLAFVGASAFSSTLMSTFQAYSSSSCFPNSPQLYPSHSSWPFSIAFLRGEPGLSKHLNWTLVSGLPPHETTWLQGRQRACVPKHSLYWRKENLKQCWNQMGQKTQRSICLVFNGDSYPNKGDTGALNEACVLDSTPILLCARELAAIFPTFLFFTLICKKLYY